MRFWGAEGEEYRGRGRERSMALVIDGSAAKKAGDEEQIHLPRRLDR